MKENVIQIKSGIIINIDASVKNIIYVKNIIFGILIHVVAKMVNIQQVLMTIQWVRVTKLQMRKLSEMKKKQKQFEQILMKKFTYLFVN